MYNLRAFLVPCGTGKIYDDNYRYTPDALKNIESKSQIHILNFNHTLNARVFYDLSLSYTSRQDKIFLFEDVIDPRLQTVSPTKNRFHLGGTKEGIDNIENNREEFIIAAEIMIVELKEWFRGQKSLGRRTSAKRR